VRQDLQPLPALPAAAALHAEAPAPPGRLTVSFVITAPAATAWCPPAGETPTPAEETR
jgi:hypothetical protein